MNNSVLWKIVPKEGVFVLKWKWVVGRNAVSPSSRVVLAWGRSSCQLIKHKNRNKMKVNYRGRYNLRQFEKGGMLLKFCATPKKKLSFDITLFCYLIMQRHSLGHSVFDPDKIYLTHHVCYHCAIIVRWTICIH